MTNAFGRPSLQIVSISHLKFRLVDWSSRPKSCCNSDHTFLKVPSFKQVKPEEVAKSDARARADNFANEVLAKKLLDRSENIFGIEWCSRKIHLL